jgi:uncharacterized membrane protein HdeD (DUF308 family)
MSAKQRRLFYVELGDWTWWAWTITTVLLVAGLFGHTWAFISTMAVTAFRGIVFLLRERSLSAFSVQLHSPGRSANSDNG